LRYRRLDYRYRLLVSAAPYDPFDDPWLVARAALAPPAPVWRPHVDVYETPSACHVTVELAGVDPETVDVQLYADALVIEGTRRVDVPAEPGAYRAATIARGPFRLAIPLTAPVAVEGVDARAEHGLVTIRLPKER